MASLKSENGIDSSPDVAEVRQCPSCSTSFKYDSSCEPKLLMSCLHAICSSCTLKHNYKTAESTTGIKCPVCGEITAENSSFPTDISSLFFCNQRVSLDGKAAKRLVANGGFIVATLDWRIGDLETIRTIFLQHVAVAQEFSTADSIESASDLVATYTIEAEKIAETIAKVENLRQKTLQVMSVLENISPRPKVDSSNRLFTSAMNKLSKKVAALSK